MMMGRCRRCCAQMQLVLILLALLQTQAGAHSVTTKCPSNGAVASDFVNRALLQTGAAAASSRLDPSSKEFEAQEQLLMLREFGEVNQSLIQKPKSTKAKPIEAMVHKSKRREVKGSKAKALNTVVHTMESQKVKDIRKAVVQKLNGGKAKEKKTMVNKSKSGKAKDKKASVRQSKSGKAKEKKAVVRQSKSGKAKEKKAVVRQSKSGKAKEKKAVVRQSTSGKAKEKKAVVRKSKSAKAKVEVSTSKSRKAKDIKTLAQSVKSKTAQKTNVTKLDAVLSSRSAAVRSHLGQGEEGEDDHESVFAIKYNDFNNRLFWLMAAILFMYTLGVDLLKEKVIHASRDDRCNRVFVDRLFAEIMVFGVVAMSVFLSSQFVTMSLPTFHVFEFADILISLGAFFLIVSGMTFTRLRKHQDHYLESLYELSQTYVHRAIREASDIKDLSPEVMDRAAMEVTRSEFIVQRRLDEDTFSWSIYLMESLNADICKFIEINYFTWLFLTAVSGVIAGLHLTFNNYLLGSNIAAVFAPSSDLEQYMTRLAVVTWLVVAGLGMLAYQARRMRQQVYQTLGLSDIEQLRQALGLHDPGVRALDMMGMRKEYTMEALTARCKIIFQATQVLAVCGSILFGFYMMHVLYNLVTFGMPWWWHFVFLLPVVTEFCFLLPYILNYYTHVQAYVDADSDVVDSVIESVGEAWHDLRFVQRQLVKKASNDLSADSGRAEYYAWAHRELEIAARNIKGIEMVNGQFTKDEFVAALTFIGVHVSQARCKRLFKVLAHDEVIMKWEVFLNRVFEKKASHHGVASEATRSILKRSEQPRLPLREKSRRLGVIRQSSRVQIASDEESSDESESGESIVATRAPRAASSP